MSNPTRKIYNHATGDVWTVEPNSEAEAKLLADGWSLSPKKGKKADKDGDETTGAGAGDETSTGGASSDPSGAPPAGSNPPANVPTKSAPGRKAGAKK